MNIICITVGKKHEHMYAEAIVEFEQRILKYTRFDWYFIEPSTCEVGHNKLHKKYHHV